MKTDYLTPYRTLPAPSLTARDYQDALDVQSACNLLGVSRSFNRLVVKLAACGHGFEWAFQHPIAVMFMAAMMELTRAGLAPDRYTEAYRFCEVMAGVRVSVPCPAPDAHLEGAYEERTE